MKTLKLKTMLMKTMKTLKTLYTRAIDINTVIFELQVTASKLFTCFNKNHMKANPVKKHLLLSSKTPKKAYFGGALVESCSTENCLESRLIQTLLLMSIFVLYLTK